MDGRSDIDIADVVETEADDPLRTRHRWCILDIRVPDPAHIIPATIIVPYSQQPTRIDAELDKTDMLPMWFWQANGSLGVPISANNFDVLPDKFTRVNASSLKVGFSVSSIDS